MAMYIVAYCNCKQSYPIHDATSWRGGKPMELPSACHMGFNSVHLPDCGKGITEWQPLFSVYEASGEAIWSLPTFPALLFGAQSTHSCSTSCSSVSITCSPFQKREDRQQPHEMGRGRMSLFQLFIPRKEGRHMLFHPVAQLSPMPACPPLY